MPKPTGAIGPFTVQVNPEGSVTGAFRQVPFSASKEEVENYIVDRFIFSMNTYLATSGDVFFLSAPQRNEENDFDFTITSPRGPAFLELMEIAPLSGPYEQAPSNYKPYDFATVILAGIREKSARYPKRMKRDLYLLLYATHWTFTLSELTVACLRYWCARNPLVFRAIFSYHPLDEHEGAPHWIFPVPPELLGDFDPGGK